MGTKIVIMITFLLTDGQSWGWEGFPKVAQYASAVRFGRWSQKAESNF